MVPLELCSAQYARLCTEALHPPLLQTHVSAHTQSHKYMETDQLTPVDIHTPPAQTCTQPCILPVHTHTPSIGTHLYTTPDRTSRCTPNPALQMCSQQIESHTEPQSQIHTHRLYKHTTRPRKMAVHGQMYSQTHSPLSPTTRLPRSWEELKSIGATNPRAVPRAGSRPGIDPTLQALSTDWPCPLLLAPPQAHPTVPAQGLALPRRLAQTPEPWLVPQQAPFQFRGWPRQVAHLVRRHLTD